MLRLSLMLWSLVGTVLAGTFILAVVAIPGLADQGMRLIPIAAVAGAALAVPVALLIARLIVSDPRAS